MPLDNVKSWYDPESGHPEVAFETKSGFSKETEDERVVKRVDEEGNVFGFSIRKVSHLKGKPFEALA